MRTKQLFLILTLLCTVVQGAWAQNFDVWDGVTTKKPSGYYDDPEDDWYITINSAAELAFVMQNYKPDPTYEFYNLPWPPFVLGSVVSRASCEVNFILNADVDMTAGTWIPIGTNWEEKRFYKRFYGNGHTVRLKIDGATDNYQGMFAVVNGLVTNLRVDGRISCGNARLVGGICGYNTGTIENCWVSADVESNHWNVYHYADLGGVCGWNDGTVKYCCMTGNVKNTAKNAGVGGIVGSNYGTVQHCTFYGDVSVDYTQNNKYVGYQTKTMENCFDVFNQGEYDADGNMSLYRRAIKYPYALKLTSAGSSTYVVSAGGEEGASATRSGETVTLTKSGTFDMVRVEIKDADGNDISTTGDINGTLTFTMPKRDVYIAAYSWSDWPTQGTGTSDDPYLISNAEEWKRFANNVSLGRDYSGQYIKLTNDISVSAMAGGSETNAFKGTFDGADHTLTFNATGQTEKFIAPFRCVGGTATIKNLKTAGRISSNNMYATGLIASIEKSNENSPSITVENCQSSMAINNSGSGDLTLSGLVGRIENATLTIRGCVFDGSLSGSSATGNAGFVSWVAPHSNVIVEDCLFAPSSLSTSTDLCATFARKDADASAVVTIARCYSTQALGERQGILCICTTSAPSQLGSLVHDYGKLQAYENGLYYNGNYYLSPTTSTNAGTEGDPYIIAHEADWESFVLWIKEKGDSFTGEYVQLATDITVSTMVGTSEIPFSGIFLGNGHTITANISDASNDGTALFRNIKGATIKDLTVAGTITGGLHAAAIVGIARGTGNSIRNCVATANVSGGTHIGGILGHATNSDIAISGCVFSGTMTGGATAKGAIVGWGDNGGTKSVTDCLYLMANGQNTANLDFVRQYEGTVSVTNSYKTTSAGTYGTHCFSFTFPPAPLGNPRQDYGGLTAYEDAIFYDGTYYLAPATLSGSGTEKAPYLICNTFEWDSFVRYVNSGTTYSGQYVKLAEDISVSTMVGTSEASSFQGTFLGGGYTLTFTQGSSSAAFGEENCAPFRYVKNATIQNLRLMGDIYTSRKFAGGLVACCIGTTNIIGCQVGTLIYSSVSGDGTHGGIVAMPQSGSTLNIEGCVYDGHLLTNSGTNSCGGFVGWHNGATISVSNSLYAPASSILTGWTAINVHTTFTFVRGGNPTITNCYFTRALGAEQGTQCFPAAVEPTALGNLVKEYGVLKVYQSGVFYAGTYYMAPASISLADNGDNSTTISEAHGYLADVTLQGRTLYKDGKWNTLCLPFSLDNFTGTPLEGATVKTLASTSFSGGTLTMNFTDDVTSIEAGKPYIVMWAAGTDIVDPMFNGVTISNATANAETDYVDFIGTYSPISIYTAGKTNLYLGADNTLYYPTATDFKVNTCRAYFQLKQGLTASPNPSQGGGNQVRAFVLNFGDDEPTAIKEMVNRKSSNGKSAWYTLDGRMLTGKPSRAGIYINNGKKVAIK